MGIESHEALPS
ncbi:rCG41180, partial [Rattus norvegicus]